jgi:hypothetical protein
MRDVLKKRRVNADCSAAWSCVVILCFFIKFPCMLCVHALFNCNGFIVLCRRMHAVAGLGIKAMRVADYYIV